MLMLPSRTASRHSYWKGFLQGDTIFPLKGMRGDGAVQVVRMHINKLPAAQAVCFVARGERIIRLAVYPSEYGEKMLLSMAW